MSDLTNVEDKKRVCLGQHKTRQQLNIVSSSNQVAVSIRQAPWDREVLVDYKGVEDEQMTGNCSSGWVEVEEKCFIIVTQSKNWKVKVDCFAYNLLILYQEAEEFCSDLGGSLASVESEEENQKLLELLTAR